MEGEDHGFALVRNDCIRVKVGQDAKYAPGAALANGAVATRCVAGGALGLIEAIPQAPAAVICISAMLEVGGR